MKLRTRLALLAFSLTAGGLALGLGGLYLLLQRQALAQMDQALDSLAHSLLKAALADPRHHLPPEVEDELAQEEGVSSALIYKDGRLLYAGGALDVPEPLDESGLRRGWGRASVDGWRVHTLSAQGLTVQVARPLAPLRNSLVLYVELAAPLGALLGLMAGGVAWFWAGRALMDLERLAQATRGFSEGAGVPLLQGQDEVAELARSFAELLGRLREQRRWEQQFLAFAAHELRTPIAAFRAGLETAMLQGVLDSAQIARLHRQALRLEHLTQNLLALSRAEAGEVRPQTLDLADLLREVYDRFQPLALERGFDLRLEVNTAWVFADPGLLEQAISNLLSNALWHGRPGEVGLFCGVDGEGAWLEVTNATATGQRVPSEGLGLRVVRTVAQSLGGRFELRLGSFAQARLVLPLQLGFSPVLQDGAGGRKDPRR
ncbi:MAG: HAMP domain-containing histidine kinase [Meiothermus sp.]|uniref:sensor histidine kinase n=1 Tax=Meiothermus sp. TaxID=1955249 RepID=UPI0025F88F67|nr:HAMP domain-containing sensor histidine kinase [Meiothermus sp.]MCS7058558.1 HAMP domain-containing histidine kinase [Meiothermus sp.]MCS7194139.1 HAMP domain-containing histidine kinase [Meiothermus sp.]MCX7739535.1 HAMP domain-containing histidine kinase [Meiothermus sp.]MDW8091793.1 HAMP domain-containing sensor histidine kinase [Meiothermus sp.]MDW8481550.1 HAMP domain-containing sensor histidine kinase [Meiothermus sp.]